MMTSTQLTAADHYARIKAELARLERADTEHREWIRFTTMILEAMMECQAIVMAKQRLLIERARTGDTSDGHAAIRSEAKDALYVVDQLTALYHRVKNELA